MYVLWVLQQNKGGVRINAFNEQLYNQCLDELQGLLGKRDDILEEFCVGVIENGLLVPRESGQAS